MTPTQKAHRLAELLAQGREETAAKTTSELCDMYLAARARRDAPSGDDARAASRVIGWISEELEQRDPAAARRWIEAEEAIEVEMLASGEWIDGASDLAPHHFYGCDKQPA